MTSSHKKILIVAFAGHSNFNPALRLANRLVKLGVDVTLCTSLAVIRNLNKETMPHRLTFAPFSDGHDNGQQPTTTLPQFFTDFKTKGALAVEDIISSAAEGDNPFDHLVYTIAVPWAALVAIAHGIKSSVLWSESAILMDIYYYYFNEYQYQDLISSNQNNPSFSINLPGLPPLATADLPSILLSSIPKEDEFLVPLFKEHIDVLKFAPSILVNTFAELEVEAIRAIEKLNFLPIGPLIPPQSSSGKKDSLNKPEDDCIKWLNTKPISSVVYVSFGTVTTFKMDQLEEIAIGLLESRRPFLWVIRDSEQAGRLSRIEELEKQGKIVKWCSQTVVLNHQAIGCFVTHCGWNSTVETLVAGVPTVAFPQWLDQLTNAKMMEDVWRIGVRVRKREEDGMLEGKEFERCVEMVMEDEDMKKSAKKWRELAREALSDDGSSAITLQAFVDDI